MTKKNFLLLFLIVFFFSFSQASAGVPEKINLAGSWEFSLDRADSGVKEKWFDKKLADDITLPGILQSQGYGDDVSTSTPWVL